MTAVNVTPPAVTGSVVRGQTLTTSDGSWTTTEDFLTYGYQWRRCDADGLNCTDIAGATAKSYTVVDADVTHTLRSRVFATEHTSPPPPTPSGAYFTEDWSSGKFGPPWTTIFYNGTGTGPGVGNGFVDLTQSGPIVGSPDGRTAVVPSPDGHGNVAKCEIRNTDPGWGPNPNLHKSEFRTEENPTFDGPFVMGVEWWVRMRLWLPNEFGLATGGTNNFTSIAGLHPNSGSRWGTLDLSTYPGSYMKLQLDGGTWGTGSIETFPLIPLDSAHRNRWLDIVIGAKFHPTAGWIEAYLDGVNVYPRKTRPTIWSDEVGPYWKQGLYKEKASSFPNGKSLLYWGPTLIGATKASVGL